jgi:hypothetical protein
MIGYFSGVETTTDTHTLKRVYISLVEGNMATFRLSNSGNNSQILKVNVERLLLTNNANGITLKQALDQRKIRKSSKSS